VIQVNEKLTYAQIILRDEEAKQRAAVVEALRNKNTQLEQQLTAANEQLERLREEKETWRVKCCALHGDNAAMSKNIVELNSKLKGVSDVLSQR
jgi:ABC-type phosphate transport system auxiliary subunit